MGGLVPVIGYQQHQVVFLERPVECVHLEQCFVAAHTIDLAGVAVHGVAAGPGGIEGIDLPGRAAEENHLLTGREVVGSGESAIKIQLSQQPGPAGFRAVRGVGPDGVPIVIILGVE